MLEPDADPVDLLRHYPRFGAGLGLHRVLHGTDSLDPQWWRGLDAIKVTGSNGKGSTCAMVAAILRTLGLRVGLYTSPHLRRVNERITVDGSPITDTELRRSVGWFAAMAEGYARAHPGDPFGAFEALTLVAMHHFARARVDVVVAEAGIGGRYDPTRVLPGPTCGLVSVDREHTALLGETLEAIALDKADLCPAGGELVVGPLPPELERRLRAYCRVRGVRYVGPPPPEACVILEASPAGTRARLRVDDLVMDDLLLQLPGRHQLDNAALAVQLVTRWLRRHRAALVPLRPSAVRRALAPLRLPGRLETVRTDPLTLVDIGHTPAATRGCAQALRSRGDPAPLLLLAGTSADRDPGPVLAPLLELASAVVCTRAYHRGGEVARVSAAVQQHRPELPRTDAATIEQAVAEAIAIATARDMTILVAGGLFVAMEAAEVLRGGDPRRLVFL